MEVQLQKWGNSQGIRIPKSILDQLDWDVKDTLELTVNYGELIIKKTSRENAFLREVFSEYKASKDPEEIDWGSSEGKEVW